MPIVNTRGWHSNRSCTLNQNFDRKNLSWHCINFTIVGFISEISLDLDQLDSIYQRYNSLWSATPIEIVRECICFPILESLTSPLMLNVCTYMVKFCLVGQCQRWPYHHSVNFLYLLLCSGTTLGKRSTNQRRDDQNSQVATLGTLLPFPEDSALTKDKISVIRLTSAYLKFQKFLQDGMLLFGHVSPAEINFGRAKLCQIFSQ